MRTLPAIALLAVVGVAAASAPARADDSWPERPAPPVPLAEPAGPALADAPRFTRDQLIELVGPVALYPDVVLAALLPATAFPLDVVAAARFVRENGGQAQTMPEGAGWDASVQSLLQYPDVLLWLDTNLAWLEQMGVAVAAQQPEVFDAIQEFRRRASAAGNLQSDEHVQVVSEPVPQRPEITVIVIQPVRPEICWVPVYDPVLVCRPWTHYGYRPISWSFGFSFGATGPWCWHDIDWFWWDLRWSRYCGTVRVYRDPCWWFGRHFYARTYGHSPTYWHATTHSRHFAHGVRRFSWAPEGRVSTVHTASRQTYEPSTRTTTRSYDPSTRTYSNVRPTSTVRPRVTEGASTRTRDGGRRDDRTHYDRRNGPPSAVAPTPTPSPTAAPDVRTRVPTPAPRMRPDDDSFRRGRPREIPPTVRPPSVVPPTPRFDDPRGRGDSRRRDDRGRGRDRDSDRPDREVPRRTPAPPTYVPPPAPAPRALPTSPPAPRVPRVLPTPPPTPRALPTPPPQRRGDEGRGRGRDRRDRDGDDAPPPQPRRRR